MGLANLCFADAMFEEQVDRFVQDIAGKAWFSHRETKRMLRETAGMSLADGLAHEIATHPGVGPDAAERLADFTRQG